LFILMADALWERLEEQLKEWMKEQDA